MTKNRYLAHIILEADTPLKVGSNAKDFIQDSPVQKDWNGLPMILGTSIAGVLRKAFREKNVFGFQEGENGEGSKIIISNALLCIDEKNNVCEKLLLEKTPFLRIFENLPIREHTAINSKGVTQKGAKFDEEVVFKGTRFKFSIEFIEENIAIFEEILDLLSNPSFRLGGGSTKGFGKFKIHNITTDLVDLENYSSSLNHSLTQRYQPKETPSNYTSYTLKIKPDDFFMFGSGFGDNDADMTPVYEYVVDYETMGLSTKQVLIPASSIKGALAHRTTYHFNKLKGNTIEAGNGLETIDTIFGHKKELDKITQKELGQKGKILISDCFKSFDESKHIKTFDHVSIDRFTGGTIDGALFQEKTLSRIDDNDWYEIEILLENTITGDELTAFIQSLNDICTGMLALGGATTKGHGIFTGSWSKK